MEKTQRNLQIGRILLESFGRQIATNTRPAVPIIALQPFI